MAEYDVGDAITSTVTFTNTSGTATDPTTTTATLLEPDGTSTSLTVTNGATGVRSATFTPDQVGTHVITWAGTGTVAAVEPQIYVVRSPYAWGATDVLTLDEAKRALPMVTSDQSADQQLRLYVSAVSAAFDRRFGPVVQRSVTETHDGDGPYWFRPRYTPVASITSVTEYTNTTATTLTAESNSSKPASGYLLTSDGVHNVKISRRSSNGYATFASGAGNVSITYIAGRFANTAAVTADWKLAAQIMLAQVWRPEQGAGNQTFGGLDTISGGAIPTFAVPNAVLQLLPGEVKPVLVG